MLVLVFVSLMMINGKSGTLNGEALEGHSFCPRADLSLTFFPLFYSAPGSFVLYDLTLKE